MGSLNANNNSSDNYNKANVVIERRSGQATPVPNVSNTTGIPTEKQHQSKRLSVYPISESNFSE
jgi:hypothetical protein